MENEAVGSAAEGVAPAASGAFPEAAGRAVEVLAVGGPVVTILVVMSVIALAIIVLKLWQFARVRIWDRAAARRALALWRDGDGDAALALAVKCRNPVARALALAIRGRRRRDLSEAAVREEVVRAGGEMLESLRTYFRPLEVIATLAPLLGLFGTVLGMISAFQQLEAAGNRVNPSILSGGIWEALLTTAVGLAVAIPTVAAINWLERVVDRLAHEMDNVVTQVFTEDLSVAQTREETDAAGNYRAAVAGAAE